DRSAERAGARGMQDDARDLQENPPEKPQEGGSVQDGARGLQDDARLISKTKNKSNTDDDEDARAIANEIGNEAGVMMAEPPALFDGIAASIDDLPRSARRYRRQIEALMGAPPEARRQQAYRALRAGSLPPADV